LDENSPHLGRDSWINYYRTKAHAEEAVRTGIEHGLDAVVLNPCAIIGPHDVRGWSRAIRMMAEDRLPGIPPGKGTFCHSREVARAHVAAVDRGRTGENYILGGVNAAYLELAQTVAKALDKEAPLRTTPPWILKSVGRLSLWLSYLTRREPDITPEIVAALCQTVECDTDRAERELGYRPVDLKTMVHDCVEWMRSENLIA
jgi:nucleoside-diphosphate-sugar epimerase